MEADSTFERIDKVAVDIFAREGLRGRLAGERRLRVKFGADPSRPDLHLGHSVPLRMLRVLQDAGHEIIFVIGDYTGMIGDPSGRANTRAPLTFEQTRENGRSYFEQVGKILDVGKATIAYNSEWLAPLRLADVLELAGKYTLARILERDDFAGRFARGQPIGLHELLYPLMQGYDSVALRADVEVGGTDQTFNLLVGRALQRDYDQPPQEVITFPLLPGLDGVEKMSKSMDNYIGLSEPPDIMYEKCMKVPDTLLEVYFRLTTDVARTVYQPLIDTDIRQAHFTYADTIVSMYHDAEAMREARARYLAVAAGGTPREMPVHAVRESSILLTAALRDAGLAVSLSEARRLIAGRGIKVDGRTVTDFTFTLSSDAVISRGKNRFVRLAFPR